MNFKTLAISILLMMLLTSCSTYIKKHSDNQGELRAELQRLLLDGDFKRASALAESKNFEGGFIVENGMYLKPNRVIQQYNLVRGIDEFQLCLERLDQDKAKINKGEMPFSNIKECKIFSSINSYEIAKDFSLPVNKKAHENYADVSKLQDLLADEVKKRRAAAQIQRDEELAAQRKTYQVEQQRQERFEKSPEYVGRNICKSLESIEYMKKLIEKEKEASEISGYINASAVNNLGRRIVAVRDGVKDLKKEYARRAGRKFQHSECKSLVKRD